MIRVLIVDDEPTIRLGIRHLIDNVSGMTVVGEAINGEDAVEQCKRLKPDIVTMDILMPVMNGYEAIKRIMDVAPCPIVVLTSIDSKALIEVSFKALALGALTVVQKPKSLNPDNRDVKNLIEQIQAMATIKVVRRSSSLQSQLKMSAKDKTGFVAPVKHIFSSRALEKTRLIVMGASTGGPPAIQTILSQLTSDFSIPIVIVQHISSGFISSMSGWLSSTTPFNCKICENGETVKSGTVYLAPDDVHITIRNNGTILLVYFDPVNGHRPSVDALFRSVADNFRDEAVGILLTGMGQDGALGLEAMHKAGAYTIAQDEASSIVFSMPKAAIDLNAVDDVLNLNMIAQWLKNLSDIVINNKRQKDG